MVVVVVVVVIIVTIHGHARRILTFATVTMTVTAITITAIIRILLITILMVRTSIATLYSVGREEEKHSDISQVTRMMSRDCVKHLLERNMEQTDYEDVEAMGSFCAESSTFPTVICLKPPAMPRSQFDVR